MTVKKIAMTAGATALLLASAVPAFASVHGATGTSVSNRGDVKNLSVNVANTGLNSAGGRHNSGSVRTGDAAAVQVTTNEILTTADCGCTTGRHASTKVTNSGDIRNTSLNVANTGLNMGGRIHTGDAYASQDVLNVVNTSVGDSAM